MSGAPDTALVADLALLRARAAVVVGERVPEESVADPRLASVRLTQVFSTHELRLIDPAERFRMRLASGCIGSLAISALSFGAEVKLVQPHSRPFHLVSTQLRGRSAIDCGRVHGAGGAGMVMVDSATRQVSKQFSADSERVHVRLDRDAVAAFCAQLLDHGLPRPLEFDPLMPEGGVAQQRWLSVMQMLFDHACHPTSSVLAPRVHRPLEELAMLALLGEHRHTYSDALAAPAPLPAPRHVRRADEFMRAHFAEPLTLLEIAAAAQVSIRTLSAGFQTWRGTTPAKQLRELRLQAARSLLQRAECSVSDAALRCSFGHFGRFAAEYLRRFGERPSQTLRGG